MNKRKVHGIEYWMDLVVDLLIGIRNVSYQLVVVAFKIDLIFCACHVLVVKDKGSH